MTDWNDAPAPVNDSAWGDSDAPTPTTDATPEAPQRLPDSFLKRFADRAMSNAKNFPKATVQLAKDIGTAWQDGYGNNQAIGWGPESIKSMQAMGLWSNGDPNERNKLLHSGNQMVMDFLPEVADAIVRGTTAAMNVATTVAGQGVGAAADTVGVKAGLKPGETSQNTGEMYNMLGWAMTQSMASGGKLLRTEVLPTTGEQINIPVGDMPTKSTFTDVATLLGDNKPANIEKAWHDQGMLPQEIVNDAQKDVTITQDVLTGKPTIKSYTNGVMTPEEFLQNNLSKVLTWTPDELKTAAKDAGLNPDEVVAHIENRSQAPVAVYQDGEGKWTVGWNDPKDGTNYTAKSDSDGQAFHTQEDAADFANRKATKLYGGIGDEENPLIYIQKDRNAVEEPKVTPEEPAAKEISEEETVTPEGETPSYEEAQKNVLSKINVGGKTPREKLSFTRWYTKYLDDLNPVRAAVRDAMKAVGASYKSIKNTASDPYVMFRLARGAFGKANSFVNYATRDFGTLTVNGRGLKDILKPVIDDLDGIRGYIASRRALELEGRGIESGFDIPSAKEVVRGGESKYEAVHRELVEYQNRISEYLKDSGLVSDDVYNAMLEANQEYTPFYRYFDDVDSPVGKNVSGRLGATPLIKKIKGGNQNIIDPLESVLRNTYTYIAMADKNAAGLKLVDYLEAYGDKSLALEESIKSATPEEAFKNIAEGYKKDKGSNTISVYRDGVRETYGVNGNKDLIRAWQGLDKYTANDIVKLLSLPARGLRAGATLNVDFMARNVFRDLLTAFVNSKGVFSPWNTAQGFWATLRKSDSFRDWQASGGSNATMVGLDRTYIQNDLRSLVSNTNMLKGTWNAVVHPIESLRATSELFENATRVGEYIRQNPATKAQMLKAGYDSRELTLDFARMGTQIRAINMLDAFFNANLQGTDRIIRALHDAPVATGARLMAGVTAPSIYLWMANHNDPRYQNLTAAQKNLYWHVYTHNWQPTTKAEITKMSLPDYMWRKTATGYEIDNGHDFKFPKPFEIGVVFGSLPERMLDEMYDRNPGAIKEWVNSFMSAMVPQLLPQFASVPIEAATNHSFFTGQPIVPDYLEKQLPEYQYNQYTTETAKLIGKAFGALPGMNSAKLDPSSPLNGIANQITSPMMLENYVRGWTGGLGMEVLQGADQGLRMTGVTPATIQPTPRLEDMTFIKSFMVRHPEMDNQQVISFRQRNESNALVVTSMQAQLKVAALNGNMDEVKRIQDIYGMRATLDKTQEAIGGQYKLIQMIYNTNGNNKRTGKPVYTADDKRQLIDGAYYTMQKEAAMGNKILDALDATLAKYKGK